MNSQKIVPKNIQNNGANIPSTEFSLAVSAKALRISFASKFSTSLPTIRLNFCLKSLRSFLEFSSLIKVIISIILSFKLFEASALLKKKANNNILIIGYEV